MLVRNNCQDCVKKYRTTRVITKSMVTTCGIHANIPYQGSTPAAVALIERARQTSYQGEHNNSSYSTRSFRMPHLTKMRYNK